MYDEADMDCIFVNIHRPNLSNEKNACPLFSCFQPVPNTGIVKCIQSFYSHYNNQILCMLSFYRMTLYNEPVSIIPTILHNCEYANDAIRL